MREVPCAAPAVRQFHDRLRPHRCAADAGGDACQPISYYGITKYAAERYVHTTAERVDLDFDFHVTCFRMYNVYGPRQALDNPYQGVLGIFLGNLLRGEPHHHLRRRRAVARLRVHRRYRGRMGRGLANPASYGQVVQPWAAARPVDQWLADIVLSTRSVALGQIIRSFMRPADRASSGNVEADIPARGDVLGWHAEAFVSTTASRDGVVGNPRWPLQRSEERRVVMPGWLSRAQTAMKLLFVTNIDPASRSVYTLSGGSE